MFIKQILSWLAPHKCLGCGKEGSLACDSCLESQLRRKPSTCFSCNKLTQDFRTCPRCYSSFRLSQVLIAYEYQGLLKELINVFKYHQAVDAAPLLAAMIDLRLRGIEMDFDLVVPVPASPKRYRQRGYNQAELLAKELSRMVGADISTPLRRIGSVRQVGSDRKTRLSQLEGKIFVRRPEHIDGRKVLLVDDVLTTGATLSECAKVLRSTGARKVVAAVAAKH